MGIQNGAHTKRSSLKHFVGFNGEDQLSYCIQDGSEHFLAESCEISEKILDIAFDF